MLMVSRSGGLCFNSGRVAKSLPRWALPKSLSSLQRQSLWWTPSASKNCCRSNSTGDSINAGAVRTKGLEFEAQYAPYVVPGLTVRGTLYYNHARYENFIAPCYAGQTVARHSG